VAIRLLGILIVYLALVGSYNILLPPGSDDADEQAQFAYTYWIATHHRLPQTPAEREDAGYRAQDGYPPLAQMVAALSLIWAEPGEIPVLDRQNDARFLMTFSDYSRRVQLWPIRDYQYFFHLLRLLSTLLGGLIIVLSYVLILTLFPGRVELATLGAASLAFLPRFVSTTTTFGDDPLLGIVMAGYLLLMLKVVRTGGRWYHFAGIGLLLGLGLTIKLSVALVPVTALLFLGYLAWREQWPWLSFLRRVGLIVAAAIIAFGWWYGFVIWHFNQIGTLGPVVGTVNAIVPDVASNISSAQLIDAAAGQGDVALRGNDPFVAWLVYFSRSFWEMRLTSINEFFVLTDFFWAGLLLAGILVAGVTFTWPRLDYLQRIGVSLVLMLMAAVVPLMLARYMVNGLARETAQARQMMMPAATGVGLLLALGWSHWARIRSWRWLWPLLPAMLLFWSVGQLGAIVYWFPKPVPVSSDIVTNGFLPEPAEMVNQVYLDGIE
jgi:4-amino-4-deoxy-L-arabinose transferase-like glycosyltransferase